MSSNDTKKVKKFKTPFKRKPNDDNICETPKQKINKTEVKPSMDEKSDLQIEDKPSKEDNDEKTYEKADKHKDFVFVSANGEKTIVIQKQLIQQMSVKFPSPAEDTESSGEDNAGDNQVVPEFDISSDQINDILESDEFVSDFGEDF